jgi:hypothetical protein
MKITYSFAQWRGTMMGEFQRAFRIARASLFIAPLVCVLVALCIVLGYLQNSVRSDKQMKKNVNIKFCTFQKQHQAASQC